MPHVISLPADIWTRIFPYIPREALESLRSVNRQFYAAALNTRFREVKIDRDSDWERELKPLLDPFIARNVRSFRVNSQLLRELPNEPSPNIPDSFPQTSSRTLTRANFGYTLRPSPRRPRFGKWPEMSNTSLMNVFLEIMHNLTCLEKYTIVSNDPITATYEAPRIHEAWSTFAPNLRTLRLVMPASNFHAFVPPPEIQCTNLRALVLNSKVRNSHFTDIPPHFSPVCEFMNGLRGTLEELSIIGSIFPSFDWLFQQLGDFEHLRSLTIRTINIGTRPTVGRGTLEFVNKHRDRICHLNLSFPAAVAVAPFELPELRISNLTSLEIAQVILVTNRHLIKQFLHATSHSLTELSIQNILARPDLFHLLSSFPIENCLKTLALSQRSFDADLIFLLAFYLPKLRSLTLHVWAEDPSRPPTSIHDAPGFILDDVYHASLTSWKLHDVTITRCERCEQPVLWKVMQLVAMHVPSVRSFCGNGHVCIPDPTEGWPQAGGQWLCYEGSCTYQPNSFYMRM